MPDEFTFVVTPDELQSWADCSQRMTEYADADDRLLICKRKSKEGVVIDLVLDRNCLIQKPHKTASCINKKIQGAKENEKSLK